MFAATQTRHLLWADNTPRVLTAGVAVSNRGRLNYRVYRRLTPGAWQLITVADMGERESQDWRKHCAAPIDAPADMAAWLAEAVTGLVAVTG